jgi:hypothetical protein
MASPFRISFRASRPLTAIAVATVVVLVGASLPSVDARPGGGMGMRSMARPAINLPAGGFHGGMPGSHGGGIERPHPAPAPGPGPRPHPEPGPGPHPDPGPGPHPGPGPGPHPPGPGPGPHPPGPGPGPHPGPHPPGPPPPYWGWDYPYWGAAAFTAGVVATTAILGSTVYALPASCTVVTFDNVTYQQCEDTWYRPQYVGTSVQYVVVAPPY